MFLNQAYFVYHYLVFIAMYCAVYILVFFVSDFLSARVSLLPPASQFSIWFNSESDDAWLKEVNRSERFITMVLNFVYFKQSEFEVKKKSWSPHSVSCVAARKTVRHQS